MPRAFSGRSLDLEKDEEAADPDPRLNRRLIPAKREQFGPSRGLLPGLARCVYMDLTRKKAISFLAARASIGGEATIRGRA